MGGWVGGWVGGCVYVCEFVAYVPGTFSRILWVVYFNDLLLINHSYMKCGCTIKSQCTLQI